MKCRAENKIKRLKASLAFSLVEAMMGTLVIGVLFTTLYAGISASFGIIWSARENLRATQIMMDRMEEFRVYKYSWVTNSGNFPSNWSEPYYPTNKYVSQSDINSGATINNDTGGFLYYGTLTVTPNSSFTDVSYTNDLLMITVTLTWTNGTARNRTMSTIYSRYGMQGYLYN